jgi:hypothetical protein
LTASIWPGTTVIATTNRPKGLPAAWAYDTSKKLLYKNKRDFFCILERDFKNISYGQED